MAEMVAAAMIPTEATSSGTGLGKLEAVLKGAHGGRNGARKGRPEHADKVPAGLDWELWVGVAPTRPYAEKI